MLSLSQYPPQGNRSEAVSWREGGLEMSSPAESPLFRMFDPMNKALDAELKKMDGSGEAPSPSASRSLDFHKFAPLPWSAYDTQGSRGWIVVDAKGRTVVILGNYVPTRAAAETIAYAINSFAGEMSK